MARQTQTAASRSARPEMREQQGSLGGPPTTVWIGPSSTSAHTPASPRSMGTCLPGSDTGARRMPPPEPHLGTAAAALPRR
ncbi:hypothetical protein BAE44_0004946 [Dichanthelium oligosanthes]|uniref:Uncharacterized protein n=1 Tax=Dichanthelium oligosanthes TaxID=888268 RepID=A0A1E5W9J9_9POAL|nr:hypothetical protein BAE44_0004946 [Dichanthelium oligosanthes]